jgi:hypothetical protein
MPEKTGASIGLGRPAGNNSAESAQSRYDRDDANRSLGRQDKTVGAKNLIGAHLHRAPLRLRRAMSRLPARNAQARLLNGRVHRVWLACDLRRHYL